jgi:RNA polymerase sigma factor (sigma-70 family)
MRFSPSRDVPDVRRDLAGATDAELLAAQDADAFALVYDRHVRQVLRWARPRAGEHAADLTAEVFARAWLCRGRFRDQADGSALPWLLGIGQNVLRDSVRKHRIEDKARARLGLPRAIEVDEEYEAVERRASLPHAAVLAVADLPDSERELLWLRVVEERPYREIAGRLRCTPAVARLRVSRLLRRIQLTLGGT